MTGGDLITISGSNFGSSSGVVFLGSFRCLNLTHSVTDPHGTVTCQTPPGSQQLLPVQFKQGDDVTGFISDPSPAVVLSYEQCAPATYLVNDNSCVPCPTGKFSPVSGSLSCQVIHVVAFGPKKKKKKKKKKKTNKAHTPHTHTKHTHTRTHTHTHTHAHAHTHTHTHTHTHAHAHTHTGCTGRLFLSWRRRSRSFFIFR